MQMEVGFADITNTLQITGCFFNVKEKGWSYPKHHHHLFELVYCFSGEARQWINGKAVEIREGDWLWIKSGVRHETENLTDAPYSFFNIHFDIDDLELRKRLSTAEYGHLTIETAGQTHLNDYLYEIETLFKEALLGMDTTTQETIQIPFRSIENKLKFQAYILLIIHEVTLLNKQMDTAIPLETNNEISNFDADIAHAIEEKLHHMAEYSDSTISQIANELHLSRSQSTKIFTKIYGISPRRYVTELKLNQAKHLLVRTSKTIDQISQELGFQSPSHFSRQFRQWIGVSPNQYRPKHPLSK